MKRLILMTIILMLTMASICAVSITNISVAPKEGSFNINMAADYYPDRASVIGEGSNNKLSFGSRTGTTTDVTKYNDVNMVSIVEFVYDDLDTRNEEIYFSIEVKTATGEFEFVSQSDSTYSRPFKLYMVGKYRRYGRYSASVLGSYEIMNNFAERKKIPSNYANGIIWFDIVLSLPGTWVKEGEILNYNGKNYFLADKNDYASLFTVVVSLTDKNGNIIESATASYPCTGYVDRSSSTHDDNFSMMVTPAPASKNIQLTKTGAAQKIADIAFTYGVNSEDDKTIKPTGKPVVFISSSNNPYDTNSEQFRFTHSNAGAFLTSRNSITYTVTALNESQRIVFDGTDYMDASGNVGKKLPLSTKSQYFESDYSGFSIFGSQSDFTQAWYDYQGELYLTLDSHPDIMNAGRYESSVFIHIMDVN